MHLKGFKEVEITGPHASCSPVLMPVIFIFGSSIMKHLAGKQFARDVAGYGHLTLIYSMPEYMRCCHGGTNVYQW